MITLITLEEEYQKHPDLPRETVQDLLKWSEEQPQLPQIRELDMINFLHSCYYDIEKTKKCILTYYKLRLSHPLYFQNRDITEDKLNSQAEVVQYGFIPEKDPNGYSIFFHRLSNYDPNKYVFYDSCKLFTMLGDAFLWMNGTIPGAIALFDMTGVKLTHVLRVPLSSIRSFFIFIQEGMPARLKAIHIVNTLPIVDKIMFIIRPFIKSELLSMIHFHSSNYDEIREFLPNSCLPSDYGGDLPSALELHEQYKKIMLDLREEFIERDSAIEEFSKTYKPKEKGFFARLFW